ncbi:MAG: hypothetical protein JKY94_17885 [Rhodobacteraceae bacterium]|nr:hypothetical protein [Paracoccaceae bacterium]
MAYLEPYIGRRGASDTLTGIRYHWTDMSFPSNPETNVVRISPAVVLNVDSPTAINIVVGGVVTAIAADTPTNVPILEGQEVQFTLTVSPGTVTAPVAIRDGVSEGRLLASFGVLEDPDTEFLLLTSPLGGALLISPGGVGRLLWS